MAKILVSLVSDQVIPNIRLIKELKSEIDNYIFISTTDMEKKKKSDAHMKSINVSPNKSTIVLVSPFNFKNIEEILYDLDLKEDDEYLVNITGGTKPMSIVAMSYFSSFEKVRIFYVPIGEEVYRQVFPRIDSPEISFVKQLNLKEYFKANSLDLIEHESMVTKNISIAQGLLHSFIKLRGDINKIPKVKNAHDLQLSEDKAYYSGGWFEELIFFKLKTKFNLNQNQIAYNVQLRNNKSKNEYDVVFIYKDTIYIVECKAYFGKSSLRAKIEKDLYKLGALDDDFGLKAKAIYITTADIIGNNIEENTSLNERANSLKVKLFQLSNLKNDSFLNKI